MLSGEYARYRVHPTRPPVPAKAGTLHLFHVDTPLTRCYDSLMGHVTEHDLFAGLRSYHTNNAKGTALNWFVNRNRRLGVLDGGAVEKEDLVIPNS